MIRNTTLLRLLFCLLFSSCTISYIYLPDGSTKVPIEDEIRYNHLISDAVFNFVDTTILYEEFNTYNSVLERNNNDPRAYSRFACYKFYSNGKFNLFLLSKENINSNSINPKYTGYRGYYYVEEDKIKYVLFAIKSEDRTLGKIKGQFEFEHNRLLVTRNKRIRHYHKLSLDSLNLVNYPSW